MMLWITLCLSAVENYVFPSDIWQYDRHENVRIGSNETISNASHFDYNPFNSTTHLQYPFFFPSDTSHNASVKASASTAWFTKHATAGCAHVD